MGKLWLAVIVGLIVAFAYLFEPIGRELHLFGPPKWEYRIEVPSDETLLSMMNEVGKEGWEMVTARRVVSGEKYSSRGSYEIIFKRKLRQ